MLDRIAGAIGSIPGMFVREWPFKLLALVVAVLAWLWVQSDEVYEDQVKASIHWTLAPGVVAVDPLPGSVAVRVRGTRGAIRRAERADIVMDADITDMGPGEHNLELDPFPVDGLPGALTVLGLAPSGVRFALDTVAERKVRVQPQVVGEPASGYAVDGVTLAPAVALVKGPAVVVDALTEVNTEPIDVSGLAGNATVPVQLDLPRGIQPGDGTRYQADIAVLALNEERTFAAVPVHVWDDPRYRSVELTVQVQLQGPAAALDAMAPDDLVVLAHLPADPDRARYEVAWGPVDGPRLRVLHAAGPSVRVKAVEPSRVEVVGR